MKLRLLSAAFVAVLVSGVVANAQFRPSTSIETTEVAVATAQVMAAAERQSAADINFESEQRAREEAGAFYRAEVRREADRAAAREARKRAAEAAKRANRGASAPRGGGTPVQVSGDLLDRLALCESGANPQKNTGNGFYGAFQFVPRTWWSLAMGGKFDEQAAIADVLSSSYEKQKNIVATKIPVSSWRKQFPGCSRKLGVA